MEQKDKDRINKFVGIWNPDDMDGMLIAVLVMSIIFPFLAYCFCFNYKINTFKSAWVIFFICYGILIIWNIYIRINIYKNQIQFFLFSGIANGVIATEFLAFFYYQGRYKLGINPGYLVL